MDDGRDLGPGGGCLVLMFVVGAAALLLASWGMLPLTGGR